MALVTVAVGTSICLVAFPIIRACGLLPQARPGACAPPASCLLASHILLRLLCLMHASVVMIRGGQSCARRMSRVQGWSSVSTGSATTSHAGVHAGCRDRTPSSSGVQAAQAGAHPRLSPTLQNAIMLRARQLLNVLSACSSALVRCASLQTQKLCCLCSRM